jgi:hypothetical protein
VDSRALARAPQPKPPEASARQLWRLNQLGLLELRDQRGEPIRRGAAHVTLDNAAERGWWRPRSRRLWSRPNETLAIELTREIAGGRDLRALREARDYVDEWIESHLSNFDDPAIEGLIGRAPWRRNPARWTSMQGERNTEIRAWLERELDNGPAAPMGSDGRDRTADSKEPARADWDRWLRTPLPPPGASPAPPGRTRAYAHSQEQSGLDDQSTDSQSAGDGSMERA